MGLFFRHNINDFTRLAIWKIEEGEAFFLERVPSKRDISHPLKRLQHLAGRFLLKYLFPDFPSEEIAIADTRKPYLVNEQYHFSISHGGSYAAAIVSEKQRVGIDIELFSEKIKRVAHKFLKEEELQLVEDGAGGQDLTLLTTFWSVKEAVFKWWSYGNISLKNNIHIRNIETSPEPMVHVDFWHKSNMYPVQVSFTLLDEMTLCWLVE
ncbi:MAG: 4'-phosphopantetheinyl transferase superfamily protein [Chitinophagaceae bacterium]